MRFRSFVVIAVTIIASNCTPTPTPQPGGVANTACGFSPNQTSNGLSLTCTVSGPLPNLRVDPLVAGNAPCGLNSWTIFDQTVNTPMVAIYGENGDDNNARAFALASRWDLVPTRERWPKTFFLGATQQSAPSS